MFSLIPTAPVAVGRACPGDVAELIRALRDDEVCQLDDAGRVTRIGLLETLKNVASAQQAQLTADFARSREVELSRIATESVRDKARRDVGAQIGLARRVSPRVGSRLVGMAKILTSEMPALMGAFRRGMVDEFQAMTVVAETATLSREHRQAVDTELAGRLGTMSTARARAEAARIGYRLDPDQAVKRLRKGFADRRVTLRPAPDTMSYLTALLPATEGVAILAALTKHAATATALGDPRGKGALMADELFTRLVQPGSSGSTAGTNPTGSPDTGADGLVGDTGTNETVVAAQDVHPIKYLDESLPGVPAGVNIEIHLVMTDRTLLDGDTEPATLTGYGPIPASLARHLARGAGTDTTVWVRRLYTDPHTGTLSRSDPRRRLFTHTDRQFLITRDQVCRTPWCDAPIRHADHTRPHAAGGPTTPTNGAGLCSACNHTKEHPGWTHDTAADGTILVTTPTGHQYASRPPNPPRSDPWESHAA